MMIRLSDILDLAIQHLWWRQGYYRDCHGKGCKASHWNLKVEQNMRWVGIRPSVVLT